MINWNARRLRRKKVKRVTIDLDPTDDPTDGAQQYSLFNGHYGSWCYLPLLGFLSFDNEPDQHLFAAILRPGTAPAGQAAIHLLRRTIARLRAKFPKAKIRVRLDGGFASPDMFEYLEEEKVEYLIAMAKNKVLERRSKRLMGTARRLSRESGKSVVLFSETRYAARSWKGQKRRVIYKAEVVCLAGRTPKDNPRFVVTNLPHKPENVYKIYRMRGDSENRIKELDNELYFGGRAAIASWRTSFASF
ncbi:MAG: transposase [Acidobacteriota bacterium]|nr:transposase [Acidobacteriota bacterium]